MDLKYILPVLALVGCMTRNVDQMSASEVREVLPSYAWQLSVCDETQPSGHCSFAEETSHYEVDLSDKAFYVSVRSIGRDDAPVVIRLHKQKSDAFEGQSVGNLGRRVRSSPTYDMGISTPQITHKFAVSDGVLHAGSTYMVVVSSNGEELYTAVTIRGGQEAEEVDETVPEETPESAPEGDENFSL